VAREQAMREMEEEIRQMKERENSREEEKKQKNL